MRHLKSGRKLKRTYSHRKALLCNLATSLIIHDGKSIRTTLAKAKELRPFIEKIITRAKNAHLSERSGELGNGVIDVHQRREVAKLIRNKAAIQELFDVIAPTVSSRAGGYTRIIKLGQRRGDGAEEAIIQLVDWHTVVDGRVSLTGRKKTTTAKTLKPTPTPVVVAEEPVVATETATDAVADVADTVETEVTDVAENVETAIAEEATTEVTDIAEVTSEATDTTDAPSTDEANGNESSDTPADEENKA
jgi:large subunit ribosomal protein L17